MKRKLSALLVCLSMTLLLVGCGSEYKNEDEMKKTFKGEWSSYTDDGYIETTMDISDDSVEFITGTDTSTSAAIDDWDTKDGYLIVGDDQYYINPSGDLMEESSNTEFYKGIQGEYYADVLAEQQQEQNDEETEERIMTLTNSFVFSDTMLYYGQTENARGSFGGIIENRSSTDYNNVVVLVAGKSSDGSSYSEVATGNIGSVKSGERTDFMFTLPEDFDIGLAHGYDIYVYDADPAN